VIKSIAIDLDDTLIDTTGLLLPQACTKACSSMLNAGLQVSLEECLHLRAKFAANLSHREVFLKIAEHAGHTNAQELGAIGTATFYNVTEIPLPLPLMPMAIDVLKQLSLKYNCYLVTSGSPEAQKNKIEAAKISSFFVDCFIVDKIKNESKTLAFNKILSHTKIQASELLSIGNRLREEIRLAKRLGAYTCYFQYGEHVGETAELKEDHPDYTVSHWSEVIETCKL
jgi:putative hydrolase of the HAD superfamily